VDGSEAAASDALFLLIVSALEIKTLRYYSYYLHRNLRSLLL